MTVMKYNNLIPTLEQLDLLPVLGLRDAALTFQWLRGLDQPRLSKRFIYRFSTNHNWITQLSLTGNGNSGRPIQSAITLVPLVIKPANWTRTR